MNTHDEARLKELLRELKDLTGDELRPVTLEIMDIALDAVNGSRMALDLANAVASFADWQNSSYGRGDESRDPVVGRLLWLEVSDRVHSLTGTKPAAPRFVAEKPHSV